MATMEIMSDGAGSPMNAPLSFEERQALKRILGLAAPQGMREMPMQTDEHGHPLVQMTLHPPQQSVQPSGPEALGMALDTQQYGQTEHDPKAAAALAHYGVDPSRFMPTFKPAELPTQQLGTVEPRENARGDMEALDAGLEMTVPGSAPRPPDEGDAASDPFAERVRAAHESLNTFDNQKRYFDLASKETTDTIMRAVEDGKMDTATALAILNVRARLTDEEKGVRAEDTVAKRPVRSPRQARNEALYRIFASNQPHAMDPFPYKE